jgi:hypothetical protein
MLYVVNIFAVLAAAAVAHSAHEHDQEPLAGPYEKIWYNTLPGDGGTQVGSAAANSECRDTESPRPTQSSLESAPLAGSPTIHASLAMMSSMT